MKIAIVSDFHLGFGDVERQEEAFEAAQKALEIALQEKADCILLAGDIFDSSIPKQETWHQAFKLFNLARKEMPGKAMLSKVSGKGIKKIEAQGTPIVAIHGTHEFRGKDYKNALQVLEEAQALIYLHVEKLHLKKDDELVVVHGLGGVPEKQALNAFKHWQPEPVENAFNILVFHQSLTDFLPTKDEMAATLSLSDLPQGFDLYVDGHLHWHSEMELNKGMFLLPGSTIFTQMKKLEAEKKKGLYLFDTKTRRFEFKELPSQRRLFYHRLDFKEAKPEEIYSKVKGEVEKDLKEGFSLKPLIRIRLQGTLAKGFEPADLDFAWLLKEFKEKAIFSLDKEFAMQSFRKKISELRELQKEKAILAELGLSILEKNLAQTSFDEAFEVKRVFDLLAEGEQDKVLQILAEKKFKKEIRKENAEAPEKVQNQTKLI